MKIIQPIWSELNYSTILYKSYYFYIIVIDITIIIKNLHKSKNIPGKLLHRMRDKTRISNYTAELCYKNGAMIVLTEIVHNLMMKLPL